MSGSPAALKRILLVLDAHMLHSELLNISVQLASALDSELIVRLIEDEALMQSAALPFIREVMAATLGKRSLSHETIDLSYRVRSEQVKRRLQSLEKEQGITWSVETSATTLPNILTAQPDELDLIILDERHYDYSAITRSSVFIARHMYHQVKNRQQSGHIVTILDDGPGSDDCLQTAIKLALHYSSRLYILVPAQTEEEYLSKLKQVGEMPVGIIRPVVSRLREVTSAEIGRVIRWLQGGMLIIPSASHLDAEDVKRLVQGLHMQLLIVRSQAAT
jgi:hypothetical protein